MGTRNGLLMLKLAWWSLLWTLWILHDKTVKVTRESWSWSSVIRYSRTKWSVFRCTNFYLCTIRILGMSKSSKNWWLECSASCPFGHLIFLLPNYMYYFNTLRKIIYCYRLIWYTEDPRILTLCVFYQRDWSLILLSIRWNCSTLQQ